MSDNVMSKLIVFACRRFPLTISMNVTKPHYLNLLWCIVPLGRRAFTKGNTSSRVDTTRPDSKENLSKLTNKTDYKPLSLNYSITTDQPTLRLHSYFPRMVAL